MRVHVKTALAGLAVAWAGYHTTLLGYTGGTHARSGPAVQQAAGAAGRSTEKPADTSAPKAEPTPVGTPFGEIATKVIGPAGGTVKSADGAITLEVPPGAVSKDATFSIQAITNNAPGRIGDAFRITPEGTTFKVPVTITFRYTEDDVVGSSPALLRVGYQDKQGYWRTPVNVSVNEASRTVSVATTHLSDWTLEAIMRIEPARATVKVGQTVELKVWYCAPPTATPPDRLDPQPLEHLCQQFYSEVGGAHVDRWSVNGIVGGNAAVGVVSPKDVLERATYVAPAKVDKTKEVAVTVEYHSPGSKGVQLLNANITVIDPRTDCAELRDAEFLKGGMTFSYEFSGTSAQGHQYVVRQGAHLAATLKRVRKDPSTWVWRGPAQADGSLNDSLTIDGVKQSVTGNGGFIDSTYMVVTVRVRDCTYIAVAEVAVRSITTMEVGGQKLPSKGNTLVGSAGTGMRPVKEGMWGSGDFALSPEGRETEGNYHSGGFGKTLTAAFKPGELGTATVTWVVGLPERSAP